MADESLYDLAEKKEQTKEMADEDELYKQMKVVSLDERKRAKCESCVKEVCSSSEWLERRRQLYERARQLYERMAVFLCFVCEMYVCAECLPKHRGHDGMKVGRKENEGIEEQRERDRNQGLGKESKRMRLEAESERESLRENKESDIKRMRERLYAKKLWDDVMNESETESEEKFKTNKVNIIDRVKVKHELDQTDCWITGLCGLENKRLVVCDINNSCIKIFKLGSHVLQRYIRFVEPRRYESIKRVADDFGEFRQLVEFGPYDVTEIDLKQNSTEPNLVSGSSSDISVTDRADPDKQYLIAVTLPCERQIMFIGLSKKTAKPQKVIKTEGDCYDVQFYDDKIFTVCEEYLECRCYIYSTAGERLNKFDTGIYSYFPLPHLAVVSGRLYLTNGRNNKVECRNVEGELISKIKIERSWPAGTSVDPDNNVYVCAWLHNKVYKLDADLTRYKSVLDQTTDYIEYPRALCYYRDKLFISHLGLPSLENFVTVVRPL